jgi:hypothetical protein
MHRPLSPLRLAFRLVLLAVLALALGTMAAKAQLVTPKTVPVLQDEQFNIVPTSRPGIGGASIATDDSLADPFSNPAKVTRLRGFSLATAPYAHTISGNHGGGYTLPIALFGSNAAWSGGLLVALQELDRVGPARNLPMSERAVTNQYLNAVIGRRFDGGVSVGASAYHAGLGAIDGVDLLYAGSDRIDQSGSVSDYRLGTVKEWTPGHSFELLALHNRTNMTHDVHFTTWVWDPVLKVNNRVVRQEQNLDQTHIWGVHSQYMVPVGVEGWRVGLLATANRLSHPKIPNYVVQNIPRDPGTTYAFNLGVEAARVAGPVTFVADLIIEPMSANTYADMTRDTTDVNGVVIPAGERTIENRFSFHNSKGRIGAGRAFALNADSSATISIDLGVAFHSIGYGLRQTNHIQGTERIQNERWVERMQTLGIRFRSSDLELSYTYRRNCGNQSCGEDEMQVVVFATPDMASAGGIIAAPGSPLFMRSGTETTHRLVVALPIR